tara:strand:- start:3118 stop:4785 length:1668 start_codon:yes stop_codon:yes gene_type:complete
MATVIQIKRSSSAAAPSLAQLSEGEMAYAQDATNDGASAKLYIESADQNGAVVHAVGGYHYTKQIDDATAAKTANTLAKRDANGAIAADVTGDVTGNADTATAWATARTLSLSGDAAGSVSIDGSGNVDIAVTVTGAEATSLTGDVTGDVYSEDGLVKILENGTDGSDAVLLAAVTGDLTGNSAGVHTGNVTGDLTGNSAGVHTGAVTGDVTGDLTGAVTGNVTGDLTGNSAGTHTGAVVGNVTGDVTGAVTGNASTATALATSRNFSAAGADVSAVATGFDGTGNVELAMVLGDTGVTAGSVGSTTEVPILTVDAKGRITSASTATIATALQIGADSGSDDTVAGGEKLTIAGTANEIETTVTNNQIQVGIVSNPTLSGDVTISGGLTVAGTTTTVNSTDMDVADSLVRFARDNGSDALDIGFVGKYNDGSNDLTAGLFRDASDGKFNLFINTQEDLSTATTVDKSSAGYAVATMVANLEGDVTGSLTGGTVSGLSAAIAVADGGTGATNHTANGILVGAGGGAMTTITGTLGQIMTCDVNGVPSFGNLDGGTF